VVTLVAATLAAGSAAFLLFNWSPASVFLGDVGSGVLGYSLGALPLLVPSPRRAEAVLLAGCSLFLFLADATACLIRRAKARRPLHQAHREHLYQRWVASGASHAFVAARVAGGALALSVASLAAWHSRDAALAWAALAACALLFALEWAVVRSAERQPRPEALTRD